MRWLLCLAAPLWACTVGLGDPCAANAPCPTDLECRFSSADAGQGYCDVPLREFGERCSRATECGDGLTCSNHFTPGERYGSCVHQRAAGQVCFADRDCVSGDCQGATPGSLSGVCAP